MSQLHRLASLLLLVSANAWATGATLSKVELNYTSNGSTYSWVTISANQTITIAPNTTFYVRLTRTATGSAPWTFLCGLSSVFPDSAQSSVSTTTAYTFLDRSGTGQWRVAVDAGAWFYFNIQTSAPTTYTLNISVNNIPSNPSLPATGNGRVSLFTSAGVAVGSPATTNASRQVSFSGLAAGNYYYTVEHLGGAFGQVEYWGRRNVSIAANTTDSFTRDQPYLVPTGFVDLTNASAPIPTGSSIPPNHQVRGDFSILQPNGTSTVRMLLDNDKTGLLLSDTTCTGTTSAACTSSILTTTGAYYRGYILTSAGRVVDTGDWGTSVFTVAAPATYSLTVTVNNVASNPGLPTAGNGRVSLFTSAGVPVGSPLTTNASRQVVFTGLASGNYYYTVEHLAAAFGQTEYWGRRDLSINANLSDPFTRSQPYLSPSGFVDLTNASAPIATGSTIPSGHQVRADYSILQPNGTSTVRTLLDIDRLGAYESDTTCTGTTTASCASAVLNNPGAYYRGYILTSAGRVVDTGDWGPSVFTVAAPVLPDITVSALSISPAAAARKTSIAVNYSLTNSTAAAISTAFPVAFYLSKDSVLDANDTSLDTQSISNLPASVTQPFAFQLTVPETATPGIYWLFAKADATNVVPESVESNNIFSLRFAVFDPVTIKRGTTVITHGFQRPFSSFPSWPVDMAKEVCRRAGGGRLFLYQPATGQIVRDTSTSECSSSDPQSEAVLAYDWWEESNNFLQGWSESAGDALFAFLMKGRNKSLLGPDALNHFDLSNLHFIGHSRGAIVNSEAVERLLFHAPTVGLNFEDLHVTTLDPHDAGATYLIPAYSLYLIDDYDVNDSTALYLTRGVRAWAGETFHDNYWQNKEELKGISLQSYGAADYRHDDDRPGTYFNSLMPGCVALGDNMCHSKPWEFYLLSLKSPAIPNGYSLSRIGSAGVARSADPNFPSYPSDSRTPNPVSFPTAYSPASPRSGFLNGDLHRGLAGWNHKGGGGSAPNVLAELILGGATPSRTHNWFFIPVNAERISFAYNYDQPTIFFGSGTLSVKLYGEDNLPLEINAFVCGNSSLTSITLTNGTNGQVPCSFAIPNPYRGHAARLSFSFDSLVSYVKVSNIGFGLSGDTLPPSVSITSPVDGFSTVSANIAVSGSATDPSGLSSVSWRNDRGGAGPASFSGTSWTIPSIPLQPDQNLITITAIDTNGNSASAVRLVRRTTVDSSAPSSVSIAAPLSAATINGLVTFSASAIDDSGFIQKIVFSVDNSSTPACTTAGSVPSSTITSCVWDSKSTANGTHSLTATAFDPAGNQKSSQPLSFTVNNALPLPSKPDSPSPANAAVNVSILPQLSWSASQNASTYDVYFAGNCSGLSKLRTVSQPALDLGAAIGALTPSATFCWKVVAVGPGGSTSSDNWTFTTLAKPDLPSAPSPANGATATPLNQTLSWTNGANTTSAAIAFGTANPPAGSTPVNGNSYAPGALSAGVTYYWRILATNSSGTTTGPTWSFTTQPAQPTLPGAFNLIAPANSATNQPTALSLQWAASSNATAYDLYLGASSNFGAPSMTGLTTTSQAVNGLTPGTQYFWKVVARNAAGSTPSPVFSFTIAPPIVPSQPPTLVSATPNSVSGSPQTFTILARDPNGFTDINRVYFQINANSTIPANTCHGMYDRATSAFYLYNDALTVLTGPLSPGGAGSLQNSQCLLDSATSTVSGSGNDLTLTLGLSLKGAYTQTPQKVFVWITDYAGGGTGWLEISTWGAQAVTPPQPPTLVSATPATPTGSPQTFNLLARDPNGFADIDRVYFQVYTNPTVPVNTCHGMYDRATNAFYLYNDALTVLTGPLVPGSGGSLQNTQCALAGTTSTVSGAGTDLTVTLGLSLKGSYAQTPQKVFAWITDFAGTGTGWQQISTWGATGVTPPQPPTLVSASPATPTGSPQTFNLLARDPNGFADINRIYFQVYANATVPVNTCHGMYDRATNAFYLYNDALTVLTGPLVPGAVGTLQNTQCVLDGATSTVSGSGTDLTVTLGLSLKGAYAQTTQKVFVWITDFARTGTGWLPVSTWGNTAAVPPQPPILVSASPAAPAGSPQTFTILARDANGYTDINRVYFQVYASASVPANSCHGMYDRATNAFYLYNDALSVLTGPLTPASAGTLQNSQCLINGATSTVSGSGTDLTVTLGASLKGTYAQSTQKVFVWITDGAGTGTGWVTISTWGSTGAVPPQPPVVVSASPALPNGSPQTFTILARDANGYTDINRVYFQVYASASVPVNSCHGMYDRATNAFYLYDDALSTLTGPLVPGSGGTLQNSQCSINGATSSASGSGTDLTVTLGVSRKGAYAQTPQKVFVWVTDTAGTGTGWVEISTWI